MVRSRIPCETIPSASILALAWAINVVWGFAAPPPAEATASGQDTADGHLARLHSVLRQLYTGIVCSRRDKSNIPEVSSKYATDC